MSLKWWLSKMSFGKALKQKSVEIIPLKIAPELSNQIFQPLVELKLSKKPRMRLRTNIYSFELPP
jgi:hypothetical protein